MNQKEFSKYGQVNQLSSNVHQDPTLENFSNNQELGKKINPFSSKHSGYGHIVNGKFQSVYPIDSSMGRFHNQSHTYFKNLVSAENFVCLFGRTVARTNQYGFAAYDDITHPLTAEGLLHDMVRFQDEFGIPANTQGPNGMFRSFVTSFKQPVISDSLQGAEVLYKLIKNLDDLNSKQFGWVEGFSKDTESPDFALSLGRSAFFLAYFYPKAFAEARQADYNFIVFNSHHIFNEFKTKHLDQHHKMRDEIRRRQKSIHPYLADHGVGNEFRQYALLSPDPKTENDEKSLRQKILGECPFDHDKKQ